MYFYTFLQYETSFCPPTAFFFVLIIIFPHSYFSVTSGSLLFPVHRSLIKASNEEVMHNFICSSSTSGTFSYFTKIYDGFLLKGHNSPPVAGIRVTDAKWAIYRFLVEGEYCVEWFQASHSGHLTPRGFNLLPMIRLMKGQRFKPLMRHPSQSCTRWISVINVTRKQQTSWDENQLIIKAKP